MMISHASAMTLRRLAAHAGLSQVAMLETLLRNAQRELLTTMTAEQQNEYYDNVTV